MQSSPLPLDSRPPSGQRLRLQWIGAEAAAAATVAADPCDAQQPLQPREPSTPSTVGEVARLPTVNQGGAAELRVQGAAEVVPPIRQPIVVCSSSPAAPPLLAAAALTAGADLAAAARATGVDPAAAAAKAAPPPLALPAGATAVAQEALPRERPTAAPAGFPLAVTIASAAVMSSLAALLLCSHPA